MSKRRIMLAKKRIAVRNDKMDRYMDKVMWLQQANDDDKDLVVKLQDKTP